MRQKQKRAKWKECVVIEMDCQMVAKIATIGINLVKCDRFAERDKKIQL